MISPLAAAKTLCELRDWNISNLPAHKILFFAHMVRLGESDGQHPLINQPFEAWDYGPVMPQLYHAAKVFGAAPMRNVFHTVKSLTEGPDFEAIRKASKGLADKTPGQLIALTHSNDGAWANNYQPGLRGIKIPNDDILTEYRKRVG